MPLPNSVTKIRTKDGKSSVEFTESVDRVNYTMEELVKAALRDVKKYVLKEGRNKISANLQTHTGALRKNFQGWVKRNNRVGASLQIGIKPVAWYGMYQEFGTVNQPKLGAIHDSVHDNVDMIIKIESQYLSALSEESATNLIDESEDSPDAD